MSNENINPKKTEDPDLIDIIRLILKKRVIIYKSTGLFIFIGLIIVIFSPREYESKVTLLVESTSSTAGMNGLLQQLGGLSGLPGLGTMTGEEALTPDLYPDIVKSIPFLLEMMDVTLTDSKNDSTLKVYEFLDRHTKKTLGNFLLDNTIGLPFKLVELVKRNRQEEEPSGINTSTPLRLTSKQNDFAGELVKRIKADPGESDNTLIISVQMQDPQLAAQLADSVVRSLSAYIIDYRTQKAKTDLEFAENSYKEAENKYRQTQHALAEFKDRNMFIATASAQNTQDYLQAEYTLAFNVFNTIAQQVEQSKMKVQERTPVFKVIDPARVPLRKSRPNTRVIFAVMLFMGFMAGAGIIITKYFVDRMINK